MGDASEKVLRVGTLTAIGSLDPHRAHDFTGQVVLSQVFESPYARCDGRIEPRLVVGPPVRRDPSSYELEVRSDARYSDGSPVTAAEMAQSIKPALDPLGIDAVATGGRVLLQSSSWRHRPEELLSTSAAAVVKRDDGCAMGTGPFAIAGTSPQGLRLVRNPHALRRPRIDALEIRWFVPGADGRPSALVAAIEAGEIDFTLALARDDVADLQRVRKLFQPGMSTAFLSLNTSAPHFARVEVRRAMAMAIDRYRLAELCYSNPAAFVARCLLPPALGRGSDGLRHDPAAA
ncbi:MAG: hypothetical protein IAG13_20235, partial [Deltaproteobacteria bacterium]|nr:hypothetical protein [Nannocystaceae bacterium]